MDLFETTALAAGAGAPGANAGIINLVMLGGFVLIFYFLLINIIIDSIKKYTFTYWRIVYIL